MYDKLIILTYLSEDGKSWKYRTEKKEELDGTEKPEEPKGIINGILSEMGGEQESDDTSTELARFWLVVHPVEEFLCGEESKNGIKEKPFAQDLLCIKDDNDKDICPILHVTTTDIFLDSMYTSKPLHRLVPRYHLIVDSSIWNYHVSIFDKEIPRPNMSSVKLSPQESFRKALESIKKNYDKHLYRLHVAREHADLNARLSAQAYLQGAHAKGVSPFVFHSEAVVKQMIEDEFKDDNKVLEQIKNRKWRILLVDDKAKDTMGYNKSEDKFPDKDDLPWNCKLTIIEETIRHCFEWDKNDNVKKKIQHRGWKEEKVVNEDCQVLIEYAETLKEAEKALASDNKYMGKRTYDIVLLDYLLDTDEKHVQNYGFSLLNNIDEDKKSRKGEFKNYRPSPVERYFFMFISAYTTAVYERLRAETLNLSEDYWHISLGACPTNTPQLFLYNLLKLMEKRMNDSGMLTLSASKIRSLVNDIYKDGGKGGDSVRKRANKYYEKVLSLHYHYRRIMKDVAIPMTNSIFDTKGSVLMTDFVQERSNLGGLLEHFTHLVYITAFGTIRQWPEMWEEYLYFKALFNDLPDKDGTEIAMFNYIEEYILKLKGQQG